MAASYRELAKVVYWGGAVRPEPFDFAQVGLVEGGAWFDRLTMNGMFIALLPQAGEGLGMRDSGGVSHVDALSPHPSPACGRGSLTVPALTGAIWLNDMSFWV